MLQNLDRCQIQIFGANFALILSAIGLISPRTLLYFWRFLCGLRRAHELFVLKSLYGGEAKGDATLLATPWRIVDLLVVVVTPIGIDGTVDRENICF